MVMHKSCDSLNDWYDSNEWKAEIEVFQLDTPCESFVSPTSIWQNETQCDICGKLLGKRHLSPRHHCRICKRSVCASCSPNLLQIDESKELHRACTRCALLGQRTQKNAGIVAVRLLRMGEQLRSIVHIGQDGGTFENNAAPEDDDLDTALRFCEAVIMPLHEKIHNVYPAAFAAAHAEIKAAYHATYMELADEVECHRAAVQLYEFEKAHERETHLAALRAAKEASIREIEVEHAALRKAQEETARETEAKQEMERRSQASMVAIMELGRRLHELTHAREAYVQNDFAVSSAAEAIHFCEAALGPLADACNELATMKAKVTALEIQVALDSEASQDLARKLRVADASRRKRSLYCTAFLLLQFLLVYLSTSRRVKERLLRHLTQMWHRMSKYFATRAICRSRLHTALGL